MSVWFSAAAAPAGERGFADLRAGWRLTAYLVLLLGPLALLWLVQFLQLRGRPAPAAPTLVLPLQTLVSELLGLGWVALITWIFARLEHRSPGAFGLPAARAFGAGFWWGVLWGAAALSLLLALMALSGGFSFGHVANHGLALGRFALEWACVFLAVALFEEYAFRGYTLVTLSAGLGFWSAAVLLSAAFGATHLRNGGETGLGALSAGLIGLFFCLTWQRTGSLWFAVGFHFAWDYSESFVYGVPNSGLLTPGHWLQPAFHGSPWITGGSVGPEGSVWVLMVIALLFVAFDRACPASVQNPSRRRARSSAE